MYVSLLFRVSTDVSLVYSHEIPVDWENFGISLDLPAHLMDMKWPKMATKLTLLFWPDICKVLVMEQDYTALRGQEGKLILLLRSELAELNAMKLDPYVGSDLSHCDSRSL